MKRKVLTLALSLGLSCGPTTAVEPREELGEASSALSTEDRLKVLRGLQERERTASRELQKVVDPRLQTWRDQVAKERLVRALTKKNPANPHIAVVRASAAKDANTVKLLSTSAGLLAKKHLASLDELAAELQRQRVVASSEVTLTGKSGEFPLHVAVADFSWSLSRRLPTLHSEVQTLRNDARCAGDLIIDGTLDRYLRATLDERDEAALSAMKKFQQQLNCLSARQLRLLQDKLVSQVDITLAHQLGKTVAPEFTSRFRQLMAAPILLVADQSRAFDSKKPGLKWLQQHQAQLVLAAKSRGSLLHRAGLFVVDRRAQDLLVISSKGQRGSNPKTLRAVRDVRGEWSTNLLPAFLEALTSPCYGADLVLEGSGTAGEKLRCDVGCGAATKDSVRLGKGLSTVLISSPSAARACPSTGTPLAGSGTGSSGSGNPGAGGVTIGAGSERAGCVMDAVMGDRADTTGKVVSCLAALHPGSGGVARPSVGMSGGGSCRPDAAQGSLDELTPEEIDSLGQSDDGTRTYEVCDAAGNCERYNETTEDDGTVTTTDADGNVVDNALPGESTTLPGNGATGGGSGTTGGTTAGTGGGSGATGGTTGGTGGGSGTTGGTGGTGGGSGSTGGGTGGGGGSDSSEQDELDAQGNPHNDNGEDQCGVNPQCREPATGSCDRETGSCSGGCTGNDLGTAFAACVSSLPSRTNPLRPGQVDPNLIYPTPDTAPSAGVGGILACAAGGTPSINTCAKSSVALCPEGNASCACSKKPVVNTGLLNPTLCQSIQCAGAMTTSAEALMSGPTGLGDCGCTSVLGG